MAAILFGAAVVMGTLVTLVFPVIFVALIEVFIIPGEERMLEKNIRGTVPGIEKKGSQVDITRDAFPGR
jgi:hypothetical protein